MHVLLIVKELVNEKIRTQQLADEVERVNREIEVKMVKLAESGAARSEKYAYVFTTVSSIDCH